MKKIILLIATFLLIIGSGSAYYHFSTIRLTEMKYKGMNLVAPIKSLNNSTFDELKALHVNAVSLSPYAFVNVENASVYFNNERQWWGEKTEGITASIQLAHAFKMSVMLKPHLWISHNFYTGKLDFTSDLEWKKWEASYEAYILFYAKLAQKENIEVFCFGTELGNSVAKRPEYWNQLITKIKNIYKGKLTYAANWDDFDKVPFWNQLDYIGIDAYFPLSDAANPTVDELTLAWKKHIEKIEITQKKFDKKIMFTEFGYRNSDFSTQEPWTEHNNSKNNEAQVIAYDALFRVLTSKEWFVGGFAWKWYADDYHRNENNNVDYTPQDKPALETIRKWYK